MHATLPLLFRSDFPALRRRVVETLQVNLGYRCNQSCVHCHVNAGPNRTEEMSLDTIDAVVTFLAASPDVRTLYEGISHSASQPNVRTAVNEIDSRLLRPDRRLPRCATLSALVSRSRRAATF